MLSPRLRFVAALWIAAAAPEKSGAETAVSFKKEIAPLLQRRCVACHGEDSAKGGYRLDTFARLATPGDSDLPALTPRTPDKSELYVLLLEADSQDRMPQKADALPAAE